MLDPGIDHGTIIRIMAYVGPSAIASEVGPGTTEASPLARRQIAGVKEIVECYNTGLHAHAYRGMVRVAHGADPELLDSDVVGERPACPVGRGGSGL